MILGTANMGMMYNGVYVNPKEKVFELFDEFRNLGGEILDVAPNYGNIHQLVKEYGWDGKIITKVWTEEQIEQCFKELGVDHIYCIMCRDTENKKLLLKLHEYRNEGKIEKVGCSIYYPHETSQYANAYHIPFDIKWINEIDTMLLHADVYIRSFYNLGVKVYGYKKALKLYEKFFKKQRTDLNHKVELVVGCDTKNQLIENMEMF